MPRFDVVRATSVPAALERLGEAGSLALAGGTDLVREMRRGTAAPARLVAIAGLAPLRGIERGADGSLRVGAAATLTEVGEHADVRERFEALAEAAVGAASRQIRNVATVGGNLCQRPSCWYYRLGPGDECVARGGRSCAAEGGANEYHGIFPDGPCVAAHPSDLAPALVALGAHVRTVGAFGPRTLPVEDFFRAPAVGSPRDVALEPGELILDVVVSAPAPGSRSVFEKARDRRAFAFALASVAVAAAPSEDGRLVRCRVAASGVGPRPYRLRAVEAALEGRPPTPDVLAEAATRATAGARPLAENGYKTRLLRGLVRAAIERLAAR